MQNEEKLLFKAPYINLLNKEQNFKHADYMQELQFCTAIQRSDKEGALKHGLPLLAPENNGRLHNDPLTNIRYLFVSYTTLVTRYCIEGGMEHNLAHVISDLYIQDMNMCKNESDIVELYKNMIVDFVDRMKLLNTEGKAVPYIKDAITYITNNLGEKLTIEHVSGQLNISASYLSHLFQKEVGLSFSNYVQLQRIEAAKELLKFSNYSCAAIASMLTYSSQSHFISVFKRFVGLTPTEYRKKRADTYAY